MLHWALDGEGLCSCEQQMQMQQQELQESDKERLYGGWVTGQRGLLAQLSPKFDRVCLNPRKLCLNRFPDQDLGKTK